MRKAFFLILLCLLISSICNAQRNWEKKLKEAKYDTTKLRCYAELALIYGRRNLITANYFLLKGEVISNKYPLHSANLLLWEAFVNYNSNIGDNSKRKFYNIKIKELAIKLKKEVYIKKAIFEACNLLTDTGDFLQAVKKYYEYEKLLSPQSDQLLYSELYSNLALCYAKLQNYEKSKENINKSLLLSYTKKDSIHYYIRMSTWYFSKTLPKIEENYKIGLKLSRELHDVATEVSFLSNMATYYIEFNKQDDALIKNKMAFNLATQNGFVQNIAFCNLNFGNIYHAFKQYRKALYFVNKGIVVIRKSGLRSYLLDALYTRRVNYEALGDYKNAYRDLKETIELINQTIGAEKQKLSVAFEDQLKIKQTQIRIETEILKSKLQEERIATEKKQKYGLLGGLLVLVLLLILASWNFFKARQLSQKLEEKSTKLEQKSIALEKMNRSKDKLFGVLSHDLREPLNELKTMLMLFYSNDITEAKMVSLSKTMNNKLFTLQMMLDNLLNWAVIQLKNDSTNSSFFDLEPMLNRILEQLKEQIDRKQIEIVREKIVLKINGNETQLEIVLRNILSNAIKFSPIKGEIVINVASQSKQVQIRITDMGTGITTAQMEDIFNYPISQRGTIGEKGTGLGLRLCKELLEKNKGKLLLNNEYNKGLTALIILSDG